MKQLLTLILLLSAMQASAQKVYVCQPSNYTEVESAIAGDMTFSSSGDVLSVAGDNYNVKEIDSVVFTKPAMTVSIAFTDGAATVDNHTGGLVSVISNVNGHVALSSAANETGYADEVDYIVSGSGNNNSLYIEGDYKLTLTLNGVTLTNPDSAAIRVRCGKRIAVVLPEGTTSTLTDGTGSDHDACFWIKGHAEFDGAGLLNLVGNYKHAFKSGEYCMMKKGFGTLCVTQAVSDGIHCGEYFKMNGGTVGISGTLGDGVDADSLGNVLINGGYLSVTLGAVAGEGIQCDSTYTQNDGTVLISIPSAMLSAKGIDIGKNGYLNGGKISATVAANGSKGIKGDGNFTQAGGSIVMDCSGGKDKVTDPSDPSKCYGIKLDGNWTKTGGTCAITTTSTVSAAIKGSNGEFDGSGVAE